MGDDSRPTWEKNREVIAMRSAEHAAEKAADKASAQPVRVIDVSRVVITGFDISFGNMFGLLMMIAVAAVPVGIIVGILYAVIAIMLAGQS